MDYYILSVGQEDWIEVKAVNWQEAAVTRLSQGKGLLDHFCGLDNVHVCVQTRQWGSFVPVSVLHGSRVASFVLLFHEVVNVQ